MPKTPGHRSECGNQISRRKCLQIGGVMGLSLSGLAQARAAAASATSRSGSFGRAKSCIILFMAGGPPQHETWDPKPDASADIRGDFQPIATSVPGLNVGELMPRLAVQADRWSVLRAVRTADNAHSASGYYMLTGQPHSPKNQENATPKPPNIWPSLGAVVNRLQARRGPLPGAVTVPEHIWNTGMIPWPGQDAGFLGRQWDPWRIHCDPNDANFQVSGLGLPPNLTAPRVRQRLSLLEQVNGHLDGLARTGEFIAHDAWTGTAIDLLSSGGVRRAFDLEQESANTRDRYGRHRFGQSVLLARRLVEAGVSLVQVNWTRDKDGSNASPMWDTHQNNSQLLRTRLMPPMDLACSALIEELEQSGKLDETLVVWMGEFGRTPKINRSGGRDHWGSVFSVAMAGGGIGKGIVHGASDLNGGQPHDGVVFPEDIAATIFHCLGISPESTILDHQGRPLPITRGEPIREILG